MTSIIKAVSNLTWWAVLALVSLGVDILRTVSAAWNNCSGNTDSSSWVWLLTESTSSTCIAVSDSSSDFSEGITCRWVGTSGVTNVSNHTCSTLEASVLVNVIVSIPTNT